MPLGDDLRLVGHLASGKHGLVLLANGGEWTFITPKNVRHLAGSRVNVDGQRTGFNEITCDAVWRCGTARPRSRAINRELLFAGAILAGGYAATFVWLIAAML